MPFDEPANLFVTGFIGSPAMYFLPGRPEGDAVRVRIESTGSEEFAHFDMPGHVTSHGDSQRLGAP